MGVHVLRELCLDKPQVTVPTCARVGEFSVKLTSGLNIGFDMFDQSSKMV